MESHNGELDTAKLLRAQSHIWNHIFSFINSMSLKCAVDLHIPDIIHNYGQPMPLSKLIASLPIHPSKTCFIDRLMRILIHSGFFSAQNVTEQNELDVKYVLTDASILLLKDYPFSVTPFLHAMLDPILTKTWYHFSAWLKNDDATPFETAHGMVFWDYLAHDPNLNHLFNDGMASDARLVSGVLIEKYKEAFEGFETLVDVGGGTGTMAKAIASSFPQLECIVFDLPHVVTGLQGSDNLKYVGGNMFEAIPPTDAILIQSTLHNWNDEECVNILKKCKEAITSKGKHEGKVIIIDMVISDNESRDNKSVETQLFIDMLMMVVVRGKERNEKEWAKLFFSAGFIHYKITPVSGLKLLLNYIHSCFVLPYEPNIFS